MLLTCSTQLLSVAVVMRDDSRYPWLALVRFTIISGVFIFTGFLMNRNAGGNEKKFPSEVSHWNGTNSERLAICFQNDSDYIASTVHDSATNHGSTLVSSTPSLC